MFKHPITPADAAPDQRPRALCIDAIGLAGREAVESLRWTSTGDASFEADAVVDGVHIGRLAKRYEVADDLLRVRWKLTAPTDPPVTNPGEPRTAADATLHVTLNLAMPSCDGFLGRVVKGGGEILGGFGTATAIEVADAVTLEDGVLGGHLSIFTNVGARWRLAPVLSVSQSEAGFEKIMQALCVELAVPIAATEVDFILTFQAARTSA
jgi:hypothetical protein